MVIQLHDVMEDEREKSKSKIIAKKKKRLKSNKLALFK